MFRLRKDALTQVGKLPSADRPLRIWAVSDGRAGIEAQVVGLSDAIARLVSCEITVKRVGWKGRPGRLPW